LLNADIRSNQYLGRCDIVAITYRKELPADEDSIYTVANAKKMRS